MRKRSMRPSGLVPRDVRETSAASIKACRQVSIAAHLPAKQASKQTHLQMVSHSMPEKPNAESPSTATDRRSGRAVAAAIAAPRPTPIAPHVPASSRSRPPVTGSRMILH